jgi:indole-3-glycerol phosphate synthase
VKRASPSAGTLAAITDPVALARRYAEAGAAAISVLTEPDHFHGSLADLRAVSAAGLAPTLRKDFVTHPTQLFNAKRCGASAALLIAAVLGRKLGLFLDAAEQAGVEALVEVHDAQEFELALEAGARVIGINHRDLRTFEIDLTLSARLLPRIPPDVRVVAESGVRTLDDAQRLRDAGLRNLLVGEALVRSDDPGALLRQLGALR